MANGTRISNFDGYHHYLVSEACPQQIHAILVNKKKDCEVLIKHYNDQGRNTYFN